MPDMLHPGMHNALQRAPESRGSLALVQRPMVLSGLVLAVAVAVGLYLWSSSRVAGSGYPLDDAWIHQTYARNFAERGEWAFIPGQQSAGSTSPLWSVLLSAGYLMGLPHFTWSIFLGSLSLFGLALVGETFFRVHAPDADRSIPWAALFLIGEWHLIWASVSGMETLLAAFFVLLVLASISRARGKGWLVIGSLIGAGVWVRPDAITLIGPAGFCLLLVEPSLRRRLGSLAWLAAGLLLAFMPYLLFNLAVQGSLWPNTFYAKQAEYAVLRDTTILARYLNILKLPLIGSGLFLLPGFVAFTVNALRGRRWAAVAAVLWFLGYALVYAIGLPVTYQYGRYFMPAMPVYFCAGLAGSIFLAQRLRTRRVNWMLARVWLLSGALVWISFFAVGAGRYAMDVAIIESEMVTAARWVADNTPADALVAAHDIGALGYFGGRRLLDLAGLVSPEVIPFIRDEEQIAAWLDAKGADYLVVFSGWYQHLPEGKPVIFQTTGEYAEQSGGTNTLVIRWRPESR